eukprot:snap_masked-scaffold_46-processed-gene-0.41-mRNA-1 protein AED:1.00 eAED:1.00 QI:0/0/0/0/1/1/2/0/73
MEEVNKKSKSYLFMRRGHIYGSRIKYELARTGARVSFWQRANHRPTQIYKTRSITLAWGLEERCIGGGRWDQY